MRDVKRINRILGKIEKLWMYGRDDRFYQLLINVHVIADDNGLWNIEDDVLERHLDFKLKQIS